MRVDLMRTIDFWVGRPLCFILTGIDYFVKLLRRTKRQERIPRKILFIKLSEMGSTILAYPFIGKVKKQFPEVELFFLVFEKNRFVLDILNVITPKNILIIREKNLFWFVLDTLRVIIMIRRCKIDTVFDLELFSRFTAVLTYLSGAGKRIGFFRYTFEGLYRGNLLTHKVQYNPLLHISKSFLSLVQVVESNKKVSPELEYKIDDKSMTLPSVISLDEQKDAIWRRLYDNGVSEKATLVLIGPGDGLLPLREWPMDNFIALSKKILEDNENFIVIVGSGEKDKADKLFNVLGSKKCINLHNNTTMQELLALFDIAQLLVTNDCGLVHIASLTNIKKFIFYGPESPQIYSPLGDNTWIFYSNFPCSPCFSSLNHRKSACRENKCLKVIKVSEVFNLIKSVK